MYKLLMLVLVLMHIGCSLEKENPSCSYVYSKAFYTFKDKYDLVNHTIMNLGEDQPIYSVSTSEIRSIGTSRPVYRKTVWLLIAQEGAIIPKAFVGNQLESCSLGVHQAALYAFSKYTNREGKIVEVYK